MNIHVSGNCAMCFGTGYVKDTISKNMGNQVECNVCGGRGYYTAVFKVDEEFNVDMVKENK